MVCLLSPVYLAISAGLKCARKLTMAHRQSSDKGYRLDSDMMQEVGTKTVTNRLSRDQVTRHNAAIRYAPLQILESRSVNQLILLQVRMYFNLE